MSDDIFIRVKKLLENHVDVLNKHSIGDDHAEEAQDIIDELNLLIKYGFAFGSVRVVDLILSVCFWQ